MKLNRKRQEGIVLMMSLVMLLLLTLLGVSSIQTTSLQQRMARNANDANMAFQAAESAVRDGEDYLETLNALTDFDAASGEVNGFYYEVEPGTSPNWRELDWAGSDGFRAADTTITGVAGQPKYILEHIKTVISDADALNLDNIGQDTGSGRTQIFRVTARGTGGTAAAQVMIQATYGKRF
jgi:type IV pilus assembly protein PilX